VLYGRARIRTINSKEQNYIELDGIVAHNPIPDNVKQQLSAEFSELLPRKITIDNENDIFAFELTSEWTELVAKYIIAIAATISGDLSYAEVLYRDVQAKLFISSCNIPAYTKLKERIPVRLAEIHQAKATYLLNTWSNTHNHDLIEQIYSEVLKIESRTVSIRTIYLKAISVFLMYKDVDQAMKIIKTCPKGHRDAIWHFNLAFLEGYKGNINKAMQHYRNALKFTIEVESLNQIESFLTHIADNEPNACQLYFCLGYINWKIKGDNKQAINDYNRFIELANEDVYNKEVTYAKKWINDLEEEIMAN
jgi:tetratricopeptide (TPR) repeat protein